ncbi:Globin-like protein 9 [Aphelenchoides bicaudatus]|nr:Globin-like protein 9 [Aphelenchoides bicaudatus]
MGAKQSTDKLSLAEKRYRINSPKKTRRRSQQRRQSLKLKTTTSMSLDHSNKFEENVRHSHSTGKVSDSGPITQTSIDSVTPIQTPTTLSITPFFTDQQEIVNKYQKLLIEKSWKSSKKTGADHVGSKVFLLVLIAEPDIKMIFGLDKIPQGRLKYDPRFRKHTSLISKSFDFAVKNLAFAEKLAQHFHSLGKKHVAMQGRGFKSKYWNTFSECLLQTTSDWLSVGYKCHDTMDAWKILIAFIIRHMQIGFEKEKLMRKRYTPAAVATNTSTSFANNVAKPQTANQRAPRNQLSLPCRQPTIEHLSPPVVGRSANERSASWVGSDPTFVEDFSRLRMTASQRHPKNHTPSRQSTAPERERPDSPTSDYYTPPSSRRQLSAEATLEKKLLNAQHRTKNYYYVT